MPTLFIHAINSSFNSRDGGADYNTPETALTAGIQSALDIAVDEMREGKINAAVEVCIEEEDGTAVLRSVVAVSVSPLLVAGSVPAGSGTGG